MTKFSLLFLLAFGILALCIGVGIIVWQVIQNRRVRPKAPRDRLESRPMRKPRTLFLTTLAVFLILIGLVVSVPAFEEALSGPKVTVTVSPETPSSYVDTSITIETDDLFGITEVSILDKTKTGLITNINWGDQPPGPWKHTYNLSDIVKYKPSLQDLDQILLTITVTNRIGIETTFVKKIEFHRAK